MRALAAAGDCGGGAGKRGDPGVDRGCNPGMIRGPPADGSPEAGSGKKSSSRGVDSNANPCMMGGSLGRYGVEGQEGKALRPDLEIFDSVRR